ncbi:alpha/beta hydrolase [bacterium]|nr:alpha/beta hydrolase [bacterium]
MTEKVKYGHFRLYGQSPFTIVVVHGGPGAAGEMAPLARMLASHYGVLEPFQTAHSIEAQTEELGQVIVTAADPPVKLLGYSWGAWLSFMLTAAQPQLVSKLLLVSSGPFEQKYSAEIQATRMARLSHAEKIEMVALQEILAGPQASDQDKDKAFRRFGDIIHRVDSFDPLPETPNNVVMRSDIFEAVWPQAVKLRATGDLLEMCRRITCPVVAIHGDFDPHPARGVERPLSKILDHFRFRLLTRCGHTPWLERQAQKAFVHIVLEELAEN